jgi:hypothetical protein
MADGKICGCEQGTFIKIINCVVGILMVVMGVFNMFGWITGGSAVVLLFGFFFYQM